MKDLQMLMNKIRRMNGRGLVRRAGYKNNTRYLQLMLEGGLTLSDIEHLEPFGFTSHPLPGAEAIALAFNGNGSHTVALLVGDQRYRLKINEGECAIYNQHGDKVHIKKDRTISVDAAVKVALNTPLVECAGDLTTAGKITAAGKITGAEIENAAGQQLGQHRHTGDSGGTTGDPI